MHVHLPKPLHGWREFTGEVGIIVIAILLALSAEYLLEQRHWRHQAEMASEAIKTELLSAALVGYERRAIQPCLLFTLDNLVKKVRRNSGDWTATPQFRVAKRGKQVGALGMPFAYRAPSRLLTSDAWQNAIATGTLNHMSSTRVDELSGIYDEISQLRDLQAEEASASTRLSPLAFNGRMDDRARADMIAAIAEVDRINDLMAVISDQMIEAIAGLKLGFSKTEALEKTSALHTRQREYRGTCVTQPSFDLS
jgi:hypothetical protein